MAGLRGRSLGWGLRTSERGLWKVEELRNKGSRAWAGPESKRTGSSGKLGVKPMGGRARRGRARREDRI